MLMGRVLPIAIASICSLLFSCVRMISHDERAAATTAADFAQRAFVARDFPSAHALLSSQVRSALSVDGLAKEAAKMHGESSPSNIKAIEFEPLPGQTAMYIYLVGSGGGQQFFYRLAMEGDKNTGYLVSGFFRGNGPYPSKSKLSLPPE
jgi:hypothetical protein